MTADEFDSDLARRKFAEERSHKDASVSNESIRSTANVVILINGGAATAILAYLAKDKLDPHVLPGASLCLIGYVFGVFWGACMMYCSMRSLDDYQQYWRLVAHPEGGRNAESCRESGYRWWKKLRGCFWLSMACFLISSGIVACMLSHSTPP